MKIETLGHSDGSPYASFVLGHVPIKGFLRRANKGWSDEAFVPEMTRYTYGKMLKHARIKLNVSPNSKNAVKVTVSYFEEPVPSINRE